MNSADKTQYVYNNKKLIGEYTANGYVDYIYIGDLLVAINKDNSIFYVHNDHLNTPRKVTNTNNAVVFDWPAVDPFGANQPTINTIGFNIRYPGQYYDSETAYHYNYHRYYNPKTGKYLQSDPIGLDGGYNLYNYVDNNSLSGIDPEGLNGTFLNWVPYYSFSDNYSKYFTYMSTISMKFVPENILRITSHGSYQTINQKDYKDASERIFNEAKDYFNSRGNSVFIELMACQTGAGSNSIAQDMSKYMHEKTNKNVYILAPTGNIVNIMHIQLNKHSYAGASPMTELRAYRIFHNGNLIHESVEKPTSLFYGMSKNE